MRHLILLLLLTSVSQAKTTRVAIIDTGLDRKDPRFSSLMCKDARHWDFASKTSDTTDKHGHGTHVTGLIKQHAGKSDYCLMIYKYYSETSTGKDNADRFRAAMKQAILDRADIVNLSGGGGEYSIEEYRIIKDNPKVRFVSAAGNDHENLDLDHNSYYPASYKLPNVVVVGNADHQCNRAYSSSYGSVVKVWEKGVYVLSDVPRTFLQPSPRSYMSGTSQATAIHTGKILSGDESSGCPNL